MAKQKETLDYRALLSRLKAEGPQRLYMLWGEEEYLLSCFIGELRAVCVTESAEAFDTKRIEGPELDLAELAAAIDAMPFFGERTLVELHAVDVNRIKSENDVKTLLSLLSDIPAWCTVLITLPVGVAPDGRTALVKKIKTLGLAQEFSAQGESLLFPWIKKRVAAHGKTIGRAETERLVFLSGTLMNRLIPEIDKIAAYAQGDTVTLSDVDAAAHHLPEANGFELTDALARGHRDRAAELMAELLAGDAEPIMINAVIAAQFRSLYAARLAMDRSLGDGYLSEITGKSGYFLSRLKETARGFTLEELRGDIRLCAETDYLLKSDRNATPAERMEELLIRIALMRDHAAH